MKKNNIWYLGYVIGLCSLILSWTFNLNGAIKVLLTFVFAISVSVSYVQLTHLRLLAKDRDYKMRINIKTCYQIFCHKPLKQQREHEIMG